jgi:hypothetical protein
VYFKKNQVMLLFWLLLFGFVTKKVAANYGVPFLFLNPEYNNDVGFLSHFMVGFSCGGFIMAFNISSYIINGFRFQFLATLSHSFSKYCLNNFIIPALFLLVYCVGIFRFQYFVLEIPMQEVLLSIFGFLLGAGSFIAISISYFFATGSDIQSMFGIKTADTHEGDTVTKTRMVTTRVVMHKETGWKRLSGRESRDWHVDTYISSLRKIRIARDVSHYDKEMLKQVLRKNHRNAAVFEMVVVFSLLILGIFREIPMFNFPAAASVFLIFTMYLMLYSALHAWLRGWSTTILIGLLLLYNTLYSTSLFYPKTRAFGLNYKGKKAEYSLSSLQSKIANDKAVQSDFENTIHILNKWKVKNTLSEQQANTKPKLVMINTSGGGLRSSLWTFHVLQSADSMLGGELMNHTMLITGASGGMIGAAFYRQLFYLYQQKRLEDYRKADFRENISRDLLNPVTFSLAVNDLFIRWQKFKDNKYSYNKDRGYAFEKALNSNTANVLNNRLRDYVVPERESLIPMMVLTPSIVNDARKMYIAAQPVSYLTRYFDGDSLRRSASIEGVEFTRLFEEQDAMNLRFTSALRMSASFPYITPFVSLPTKPVIEVTDAGARDNFGLETSLKFMYVFRNWIDSNTSGVVILQIRDRKKNSPIEDEGFSSMLQTIGRPAGALYGNIFGIQNFNQDALLQYASRWFNGNLDVVEFELDHEYPDNISLSWHLTRKEKKKVLNALDKPDNHKALLRLIDLLKHNKP